jgi:hypothetical protein
MRQKAVFWLAVAGSSVFFAAPGRPASKPCFSIAEAAQHLNQDVCIDAHVYDVIDLADGTRFLDVCSPETADDACHFTIISLRQDQKEVGRLQELRGQEIEIRGVVHSFSGRAGIILSASRQLHGGAEKFRPNPALIKGFSAADGKSAFDDPAFRSGGHKHSSSPTSQ